MIYTRIYDAFWKDPDIRELDDACKLLYLYLLTCRHRTMIGLYEMPKGYITEDIGWGLETVTKRLRNLCERGFIQYDEACRYVFIPTFLKHNPLDNNNQEKGAIALVENLPETALTLAFLNGLETLPKRYANLIGTVTNKVNSKQKTVNSKQEEDTGSKAPPPDPPKTTFKPPTVEEVAAYCRERSNSVVAQLFINHYESNGWMVGKNKMRDWKAAVRTWEQNNFNGGKGADKDFSDRNFKNQNTYTDEDFRKMTRSVFNLKDL